MKIKFFDGGATMAFSNGQQVAIAQEPWILTYVRYLESKGIDPTEQDYELPDGRKVRILRFAGDEPGEIFYNWEVL